jgi:hypothetical protein
MGVRRAFPTRFLWRSFAFILTFGVSAGLSWWAVERVVPFLPARSSMTLDVLDVLRNFQDDFLHDHGHRRIALLGDSMLVGPPGSVPLPDRVESVANHRRREARHIRIHTLSWPAWGVIGEYCLADEILRTHPDLIVLELNLRGLQLGPLGPFAYSELAGWIRSSRLLETSLLPLSDAGITLNRLLLYQLLVASHHENAWVGLLDRQARLLHLRGVLEDWVERKTGVTTVAARQLSAGAYAYRRLLVPGKLRAQRAQIEAMLGAVLGGIDTHNGRLEVLEALLRTFRRADIPVFVWVSPVNVQHMRSLGLSMDGLDKSLEVVRVLVEQTGAHFLDLHAALPDSAFRDSGDHYTLDGEPNGAAILASRLAPAIQRAAPAPPASAGGPASNAQHAVQ